MLQKRRRIDSQSCAATFFTNGRQGAGRLVPGFEMNIQTICSRLDKLIRIPIRLFDQSVHIQGSFSHQPAQGFHHIDPKRYIGNKVPIHNVDVYPLSSTLLNSFRLKLNPA
jgi:hypothetical protein